MNYTITIPDTDRQAIAAALGKLVEALTNAKLVIDSSPSLPTPSPENPAKATPRASTPPTAPIVEARDRWARNRRGIESPNPSAIRCQVSPWKAEQKPGNRFLTVTWDAPGHGHVDANCFDEQLWPWIMKARAEGAAIGLYVVRKGAYTNIVGVCA